MGETDRVVASTKHGAITARDLYLWLLVSGSKTRPYALDAYDKAKLGADKKLLATEIRAAIDDYVFVNHVVPGLVADQQWNAVDESRKQVNALPGYQFVYLYDMIRPQINILPQDRVKYLQEHRADLTQPERWRVRYIFMASSEEDSMDAQDAVQKRIEDLRAEIVSGGIGFAEAARKHSEAPSAANGGEIPPFRKGELFFYFEDAAANLEPGGVSEVFRGPRGGFYLLQLVDVVPGEEPSLENCRQAIAVDDGLMRQVLRAQYLWELKLLLEKRRPVYTFKPWDERHEGDVVGGVAGFEVTKGQLWNMFPAIESEQFARRDDMINNVLKRMLEGEAIVQEVCEAGLSESPIIARCNEFAHNLVLRDKLREKMSCALKVDEVVVRRFWRENPRLFTPLAMKRVSKVTLVPLNPAPTGVQTLAELDRALNEGGGIAPSPYGPEQPAPKEYAPEVDEPATQGGAAPQSAAGGSAAPAADAGRVYGKPAAASADGGAWHSPLALEPCNPAAEPVKKVIHPAFLSRRIQPTALKGIVRSYQSADWQLRYEDFGFVYVEDIPAIPADIARTPVGAYSAPALEGANAVAYVVEDSRSIPKPPFEEVKAYAYTVCRDTLLERQLKRAYDRGIPASSIRYKF
jgi:parvulin-like peptidyl-prolyl isomerase